MLYRQKLYHHFPTAVAPLFGQTHRQLGRLSRAHREQTFLHGETSPSGVEELVLQHVSQKLTTGSQNPKSQPCGKKSLIMLSPY